jgi:hypothetical protein
MLLINWKCLRGYKKTQLILKRIIIFLFIYIRKSRWRDVITFNIFKIYYIKFHSINKKK